MNEVYYFPFRLDDEIPQGAPRLDGSPFDRISTEALAEQTRKASDELAFRAAAAEHDAAEWLYELATSATTHLVNLAKRTPEVLRPIARDWPTFPVLSSPKDERTPKTKKLLESISVASDLKREFSAMSRWSPENTATKCATAMKYTIDFSAALVRLQCGKVSAGKRARLEQELARFPDFYRRAAAFPVWVEQAARLPEFNKASSANWFEVGWLALMERTDNHPENVSELRSLGKYREGHTETAKPGSKTQQSNIRDGIKQKIRRAMLTIAPGGSPSLVS